MAERKPLRQIAHTPEAKTRFKGERAAIVPYDDELASYIAEQIAMGRSLIKICAEPNMPHESAVIYWALHNICHFASLYSMAKQLRAQRVVEEMRDIVDDSSNDYMQREDKEGNLKIELQPENIRRSELRLKLRMWETTKLIKEYADSSTVKVADAEGNKLMAPPTLVVVPVEVERLPFQGETLEHDKPPEAEILNWQDGNV